MAYSLSCTSSTFCVAAGWDFPDLEAGTTHPFVLFRETESGGGAMVHVHLSRRDLELADNGGLVLAHADDESEGQGAVHRVIVTIAAV